MDRQAFTTGQLVPNAQLLGMEKAKLVALGYALEAIMGAGGTVVSGLACAPTTSPSLSVVIGRGSIMTTAAIDPSTAYSDLGTDTNATIKQGILQEPGVTLTLTPPSTSGYSQTYLIQATQSDADSTTVVPFYNASNPAQPYNGPSNSGNATLTLRQSKCVVSLKAGAAATTGSQTTPSADTGNVPLYTITLVNGQTQITAGQIVQASAAPFVPVTLPGVPSGVQSGTWTFGQDTGTANNYVVTLSPNNGTPGTNQRMFIKFANANTTTTPVLNVNGSGNKSLLLRTGAAVAAGDVQGWREVFFDGTAYRLAGAAPSEIIAVNAGAQTGKGLYSNQTAGSYTWTVPAGVYWVYATCVGAGAGGSGTSTSGTQSSAGGGAGGTAEGWMQVTPGQTISYVVGAGSPGVGYGQNSSNGGTSSVGSTMQATGGYGVGNGGVAGGAGGLGTGGQVNLAGGCGNDAYGGSAAYPGGVGGTSSLGGGGRTGYIGVDGYAPGSGGGGGYTTTYTHIGGNGRDGYVSFQY